MPSLASSSAGVANHQALPMGVVEGGGGGRGGHFPEDSLGHCQPHGALPALTALETAMKEDDEEKVMVGFVSVGGWVGVVCVLMCVFVSVCLY